MSRTFTSGKYQGREIQEIIKKNPEYVQQAYHNDKDLQLTEQERYLLLKQLTANGIKDKDLYEDLATLPEIPFDENFDKEGLVQLIGDISDYTSHTITPSMMKPFLSISFQIDKVAHNYKKGNSWFFNEEADELLRKIDRIASQNDSLMRRKNQKPDVILAAKDLKKASEQLLEEVKVFLTPYVKKLEAVDKEVKKREKIDELLEAIKEQEQREEERRLAVAKNPFKDFDETFLAKLDKAFGDRYKITRFTYQLEYDDYDIDEYTVEALKKLFHGAKIEVAVSDNPHRFIFNISQDINAPAFKPLEMQEDAEE